MKIIKNLLISAIIILLILFFSRSYAQYTWIDTTDVLGNRIHIKVNEKTGAPHRIYGLKVNFKRYGMITERNAQGLSRKFLTEYAKLLKIQPGALKFKSANHDQGRWYVNFQQHYKGVPVFRAYLGFTIHETGNVILVGADVYPDIHIDVTPSLSSDEALKIAQMKFMALTGIDSMVIRKKPEFIILPIEKEKSFEYLIAYHVELEYIDTPALFSEGYFIDAKEGNIIKKYSNIRDSDISGTVNIIYWPKHYYDSQVTGSYKNGKIKLINTLGQTQTKYTNSSGYYHFSNLGYSLHVLSSYLEGKYVKLHGNSEYHEETLYPSTHNWTWDASDATNVYYHANRMHDFFRGWPFNYTGMNYQMDAYVNEGPLYNGWSSGYDIGFGSQDGKYWARSSDAVYHEYSHCVVFHLYGNQWIEPSNDNYDSEGYAMDEAFADYFAASRNNHSVIGESVLFYNKRNLDNDLTMLDYHHYSHNNVQYHNSKIISGACWDLRKDQGVGKYKANDLIFDALKMTPHAYNFEDFALNILVADDNDGNLNNGTPHYDNIKQAFETNHGIEVIDIPPPAPQNLTITNAGQIGHNPHLSWDASEGADYYNVWRTPGEYQPLNWTVIATPTGTSYTDNWIIISDTQGATDEYIYKVSAVNDYGNSEFSNSVSTWGIEPEEREIGEDLMLQPDLPEEFGLSQNYPNPANPETSIRFQMPEAARVVLKVYDLMGREICTLADRQYSAGNHEVFWNGTDRHGRTVSSGIYICRMVVKGKVFNRKITVMR